MLRLTKDKLTIEMQHPVPAEFAKDLKTAIISAIQSRQVAEHAELKEYWETNCTLLELLKQLE